MKDKKYSYNVVFYSIIGIIIITVVVIVISQHI